MPGILQRLWSFPSRPTAPTVPAPAPAPAPVPGLRQRMADGGRQCLAGLAAFFKSLMCCGSASKSLRHEREVQRVHPPGATPDSAPTTPASASASYLIHEDSDTAATLFPGVVRDTKHTPVLPHAWRATPLDSSASASVQREALTAEDFLTPTRGTARPHPVRASARAPLNLRRPLIPPPPLSPTPTQHLAEPPPQRVILPVSPAGVPKPGALRPVVFYPRSGPGKGSAVL